MSALSLRRTLLALSRTRLAPVAGRLDATLLYLEHADFVWLSLQRLGVRAPDLEDVLQEVFIVVHQQVDSFEGRSKPTTWLFGICLRVAAAYRRRAYRRHEEPTAHLPEGEGHGDDPEALTAALEGRRRLDAALDSLELDKRAVLVMFEIDGMSCQQIADVLDLRVGTVYSRLHVARAELQKALERQRVHERFREVAS